MENFLDKPFKAKIFLRTNIDPMEHIFFSNATCFTTEDQLMSLENEIVRLPFHQDFSGTQYYIGKIRKQSESEDFWITVGDGLQLGLLGGTLDNCSQAFSSKVSVLMRTIDRFDLREKLGL